MSTRVAPGRWWSEVVDRVVVDQVRSGRLRFHGWTPTMAAQGLVALVTAIACLMMIAAAGVLRRGLGIHEVSGLSVPLTMIGPVIVVAGISLTFLLAGLLQAGWAMRVVAVVMATASFAAAGFTILDWRTDPRAWSIITAMGGIVLLVALRRWTTTWWQPTVVLILVAVGILVPLGLGSDLAADSVILGLFVPVLGAAAATPTIVLAVAGSEVALSTSVWAAELGTSQQSPERTRSVAVLVTVLVLGGLGFVIFQDPGPAVRLLSGLGLTLVAAATALVLRRRTLPVDGSGPAHVARVIGQLHPLMWTVAIIIGGVFFLALSANVLAGWVQLWFGSTPLDWLGRALNDSSGYSRALAALASIGFALRARRRSQTMVTVPAITLGTILFIGAGASLGWWPRMWNQAGLGAMMAAATLLLAGWLAIRRRLDRGAATSVLAMAALSLATAVPDLIADPVAVLLGLTGAGAVFFGVVWNLLTNADLANVGSPAFPRPGRVLLLCGLVLVTMLHFMFASVVQAGILATLIEISTGIGTGEIGTALLLGGWAIVLADTVLPTAPAAGIDPDWQPPSGTPVLQ